MFANVANIYIKFKFAPIEKVANATFAHAANSAFVWL